MLTLFLAAAIMSPVFFGTTNQSSPRAFRANDAYWDLARIDSLGETGFFNEQAKVLVDFQPASIPAHDGPIMFYAAYILSTILGVKHHIGVHLLLFLGIFLGVAIIFILLLRISRMLAFCFLPFALMILQHPFVASMTWGFWKSYYSFFIFFFLLIFYPFDWNMKISLLYAVLLAALVCTHPFITTYAIILLAISLFVFSKNRFRDKVLYFVLIGVISGVLSFIYLLDYAAANVVNAPESGSWGLVNHVKQVMGMDEGYHLFGANVYYGHLGWWWYTALLGFLAALIVSARNYRSMDYPARTRLILSFVFLMYLLVDVGVTRIYQFRFTWPITVGVFTAYLLSSTVGRIRDERYHAFASAGLYVLLLLVLYASTYKFSKDNYSIVSEDMSASYEYIKANTPKESTVLLIDPTLDQMATVLLANRRLRLITRPDYLSMPSVDYDLSAVNTSQFCQLSAYVRKGLRLYRNNLASKICTTRPIKECSNNYILFNFQFYSQSEVDIMKNILNRLDGRNYEVVFSTKTTALFRNKNFCGSWAYNYALGD